MKDIKFKLTTESMVNVWGVKLFRMQATVDIEVRGVKKGDKGGWLESAEVNGKPRVSGDAWVSGDAQVYGNAQVSGKFKYTKGWFIGGDYSGKITEITDKMGTDYWENQYVLGDYEIEPIDEPETESDTPPKEITINNAKYKLIED